MQYCRLIVIISLKFKSFIYDITRHFYTFDAANLYHCYTILSLVYRDENELPVVLPVVKRVEHAIVTDYTLNKELLPPLGLHMYNLLTTKLLLGRNSPAILHNKVSPRRCFLKLEQLKTFFFFSV